MDLRKLTETFVPPKILHRDIQIGQINKVLNEFKEKGFAKNLVIKGRTGSGKTSCVRHILSKNGNSMFLSLRNFNTTTEILRYMSNSTTSVQSRLIEETIKAINGNPRPLIIDEIDRAKNIKELMQVLNTIYRETNIPMILITNKKEFLNNLEEDVKLTLFLERIDFPTYSDDQLYEILNYRLELAEATIPEETKKTITAHATRDGSARILLNLAFRVIQENNTSFNYIKTLMKTYEDEDWKEFIDGIAYLEQMVLKRIIYIAGENKPVTPSEIRKKVDISPSRLSQVISTLEFGYGVIQTEITNLGRKGGRFRVITFNNEEERKKLEKALII